MKHRSSKIHLSYQHGEYVVVPADNKWLFRSCMQITLHRLVEKINRYWQSNKKNIPHPQNSSIILIHLGTQNIFQQLLRKKKSMTLIHLLLFLFGIAEDEELDLLSLYCVCILHNCLYKQCYLTGFTNCSLNRYCKSLTFIIQEVKIELQSYWNIGVTRGGVNRMWIWKKKSNWKTC